MKWWMVFEKRIWCLCVIVFRLSRCSKVINSMGILNMEKVVFYVKWSWNFKNFRENNDRSIMRFKNVSVWEWIYYV